MNGTGPGSGNRTAPYSDDHLGGAGMRRRLETVLDEVEKVISGKRETVAKILLAFLAR